MHRLLLFLAVLSLSGCIVPTYFGSKEPHPLPIDLTVGDSVPYADRVKLISELYKQGNQSNGYTCQFNYKKKKLALRNAGDERFFNFSEASVHLSKGEYQGKQYAIMVIHLKGKAVGYGHVCMPRFYKDGVDLSEMEKNLTVAGSILASFGMEVQPQYIRTAKPNETYVPIAAFLQKKADERKLAIKRANEAKAVAEAAAQQALKDKRKNDIAARLAQDSHLSDSIKQDKYLISLTDLLKNERYTEALFYFELLEAMGSKQPDSFTYFWGESLYKVGRTKEALEKLYEYIQLAGSSGKYYTQALKLSNAAEEKLRRK